MQYQSDFPRVSAGFSLKRPGSIIKTLGKGFVKLDPSRANELIRSKGVAIPDYNIQFAEAFNEWQNELFLESGIFTSIGTGFCSVLGASVFKAHIRILS